MEYKTKVYNILFEHVINTGGSRQIIEGTEFEKIVDKIIEFINKDNSDKGIYKDAIRYLKKEKLKISLESDKTRFDKHSSNICLLQLNAINFAIEILTNQQKTE